MTVYTVGKIKKSDVDLDKVEFAIDTAGSWDGEFPKPGKGDYLVTLGYIDGDDAEVLVSRRYTGAIDAKNAAELALSAFAERHSYLTNYAGELVEIHVEGLGKGIPAWVTSVDAVT